MDAHEIREAYAAKADAMVAHYRAAVATTRARTALEIGKLIGLANGTIDGKNADLREAKAREILAEDYGRLEAAEAKERDCKLDFDIACLQVEELRALLRLAELEAAAMTITAGEPSVSVKAL